MVDATTIIAGIIFILIVIIIIVYIFFYNRTVLPSSIITDFGFTLKNNTTQTFISAETQNVSVAGLPSANRPVLTLQDITTEEFGNASQGWSFQLENGETVALLGNQPALRKDSQSAKATPSGTKVFIKNNYLGTYVSFTTVGAQGQTIDGPLFIDTFEVESANAFFLEYSSSNLNLISLRSELPLVNNQSQYIIPGPNIGDNIYNTAQSVTIGVPSSNSDKIWIVGS